MLECIDYKKVFYYFEKISSIPRGSKNNQEISDYLVAFAKEHNLSYTQDKALNVVIVKEASAGYETVPSVMIQGHMDMVCEKDSNSNHDFTKQGLDLKIDGDYIYAEGTTLGGDDGIAVAYALAILSDPTLKHPRLEVVITTDEEIGMDGAIALDGTTLKSKYLLNIDSEDEGIVLTSCAGGMTSTCTLPLFWQEVEGTKLELKVEGLQGGHSGTEIDKNRTNATLLLGRLFMELEEKGIHYAIEQIIGGLKDNAIPRESSAAIVVEEADVLACCEVIEELNCQYKKELEAAEPNVAIQIKKQETGIYSTWTKETKEKIVFYLLFTPNGIQEMSSAVKGLVESSLNLGIVTMDKREIAFSYSVRSSIRTYKEFMGMKLKRLIEGLGGTYTQRGEYPAWEYKKDSILRETCMRVYQEMYGKDMKVEAIHAGLECGILFEKMPGIDIVSIGPDMMDIHTPKEKLSISSTKRVFDFVVNVLEKIQQ